LLDESSNDVEVVSSTLSSDAPAADDATATPTTPNATTVAKVADLSDGDEGDDEAADAETLLRPRLAADADGPPPPPPRRAEAVPPPPTISPDVPTPASSVRSVASSELPYELDASRRSRVKRAVGIGFGLLGVLIVWAVVRPYLSQPRNETPAPRSTTTAPATATPPDPPPITETVPAAAPLDTTRALDPGAAPDGGKRAPGKPEGSPGDKPKPKVGGGPRRPSGDDVEIVIPNPDSE
jgi:hypothetical protein